MRCTFPLNINIFETYWAHIFLNTVSMYNCSNTSSIVPLMDETSCAVIHLYSKLSSWTWQMFTLGTSVGWMRACCRFDTSLQPSENLLHQSWTLLCDRVSSPYHAFNLRRISACFTFSFNRNLMIQCYSTLGLTPSWTRSNAQKRGTWLPARQLALW